MLYFCTILLIYSFYRGIRGCVRILKSYQYLSVKTVTRREVNNLNKIRFHILIPVLREQEIIEDTIHHFAHLSGDYHVYIITTEKEDFQKSNSKRIPEKYKRLSTTKKLAERYLNSHSDVAKKVSIIHFPETYGVVAHQYNYALEQLEGTVSDTDFIIVYNADSRVSKNILLKYEELIQSEKDCRVVQQSAAFLANYKNLSSFLKSIALLQTRWTMAHEIPRLLNAKGSFGISEGAHVVAHGLCIQYKFFRDIGWFPQDFLNEDLPLGYFIRLHGAKIYLLRELENADTPTSVKSMFNQYRTWFYGLLYYPVYIRKALKNQKFKKNEVVVWGLKYCVRAVLWFGLSITWLLLFVLPILLNRPFLVWLSLLSFVIYAPVSFLLVYLTVGRDFGIKTEFMPIALSPIVFLTHSFGPLMAVFDLINSILFKRSIYKNKTER